MVRRLTCRVARVDPGEELRPHRLRIAAPRSGQDTTEVGERVVGVLEEHPYPFLERLRWADLPHCRSLLLEHRQRTADTRGDGDGRAESRRGNPVELSLVEPAHGAGACEVLR